MFQQDWSGQSPVRCPCDMNALCLSVLLYGFLYFNSPTPGASQQEVWSSGRVTTFRLGPGEDLKQSLLAFTAQHSLSATSVLSTVGSLKSLHLRLASPTNGEAPKFYSTTSRNFEIVSLVGTSEYNSTSNSSYGHFHMSVADESGVVVGGHLMDGCLVFTTAEITIMRMPHLQFRRDFDPRSGYAELVVSEAEVGFTQKVLRSYGYGYNMLMQQLRTLYCDWLAKHYPTATCPAGW
jgi:predicted DNA-binding protein with PD1-like motif